MKIAFKTFGCRLNISETESIISRIQDKDSISKDIKEANIIVINTCTVTSEAEKKCIRFINQILEQDKICISTGCFNPSQIIKNEKLIYLPLDNKGNVSDLISKIINYISEKKLNPKKFSFKLIDKSEENDKNRFLNPSLDKNFHSRAFLKIQDGCNNNCTYCKVHIVRGEEVSLSYDKLVDSLYRISDAGFNEVVLTGINIAKYNYYNINFSTLLKNIIKIFPKLIFQLSSIEINNLDNEFFNIIKQPNIKPYFHLPLQSGSDFILSLMNRKYKVNEYIDIIYKLKDNRPDSFLSTDIIVGFPQENEKTIMETLEVVLNAGFHHLHLFPFSKRSGTAAYKMKETLSPKEKGYYIERLNKIAKSNKNKYINSFIGKKDYFIIEKIDKTINKFIISGRSYHNISIKSFLYDDYNYKKGDYLPVYIYGKENDKLIAEIIQKN